MLINFEVISPYQRIVEQVLIEPNEYAYESQTLFVIRSGNQLIPVTISLSGIVKQVEVQPGDAVISGMILAYIKEDITNLRTGSD